MVRSKTEYDLVKEKFRESMMTQYGDDPKFTPDEEHLDDLVKQYLTGWVDCLTTLDPVKYGIRGKELTVGILENLNLPKDSDISTLDIPDEDAVLQDIKEWGWWTD